MVIFGMGWYNTIAYPENVVKGAVESLYPRWFAGYENLLNVHAWLLPLNRRAALCGCIHPLYAITPIHCK